MNRQEKEVLVQELKDNFNTMQASFIVKYSGLSVSDIQELRRTLKASGARLQVTKARLMKLAAQKMPSAQELIPYFKDQIGLVFASQEAAPVAKVLDQFAKKNQNLSIIAGSFESRFMDSDMVSFMASLPSREVLLSQLLGLLNLPLVRLVSDLNSLLTKLVVDLQQIADKKKKEG